jgi:hypothetical protein
MGIYNRQEERKKEKGQKKVTQKKSQGARTLRPEEGGST